MAYLPYIWRKNNPEKRLQQKRREKVRQKLRKLGILPPVGKEMDEKQKLIDTQISNNDFSYYDKIKTRPKNEGGIEKQIKIKIKSPEYVIWYRAKTNAKNKNFEFNLDISDIIIPEYCPYLGIKLLWGIENVDLPNYYSIDRIDSSKGYVKGNIQIISRFANTMKNNATKEELITFAKSILNIYNS